MMTCKDCMYCDVCHYTICLEEEDSNIQMQCSDKVEKYCKHFKDKSRIIELPCKVGDTAYIDLSDKGDYYDECKVKHIEFNSDWTEPLFTLICYEEADYRTYWLSEFGKEWFLEPTERTKKKKHRKRGGIE